MKKPKSQFKIKNLIVLILVIALIGGLGVSVWLSGRENSGQNLLSVNSFKIKSVSAQEIYPLFNCSCGCDESLKECSCAEAKEEKSYIGGLIDAKKLTKKQILLAYIKKFGLDSFRDKERQKEFEQELVKEAPAERPIISITPSSKDLGDVDQKKGVVATFFEIQNKGKSDLIINKLGTSCGCTTASIVYQDKEGPKFGMDMGQKIPKWQVSIAPGKTAKLKVYYDPNFHKDLRGYVIREIYIYSNDPINFNKKVQIELNQVEK